MIYFGILLPDIRFRLCLQRESRDDFRVNLVPLPTPKNHSIALDVFQYIKTLHIIFLLSSWFFLLLLFINFFTKHFKVLSVGIWKYPYFCFHIFYPKINLIFFSAKMKVCNCSFFAACWGDIVRFHNMK